MPISTPLLPSSATATARTPATTESIAYSDGIVAITAPEDIRSVLVERSRDANGSLESVRGRVEVRGVGARLADSADVEFEGVGVVARIVGG